MMKQDSHPLYKQIDQHRRWAKVGWKIIWIVVPLDVVCLALMLSMYYNEPAPSHSIITLPGEVIVFNHNPNKV